MPFSSFCSVLHVSNSFISRRLALRDAAAEFDDDGGIALDECDIRVRWSNDIVRKLMNVTSSKGSDMTLEVEVGVGNGDEVPGWSGVVTYFVTFELGC
jgi:hypothetical protein